MSPYWTFSLQIQQNFRPLPLHYSTLRPRKIWWIRRKNNIKIERRRFDFCARIWWMRWNFHNLNRLVHLQTCNWRAGTERAKLAHHQFPEWAQCFQREVIMVSQNEKKKKARTIPEPEKTQKGEKKTERRIRSSWVHRHNKGRRTHPKSARTDEIRTVFGRKSLNGKRIEPVMNDGHSEAASCGNLQQFANVGKSREAGSTRGCPPRFRQCEHEPLPKMDLPSRQGFEPVTWWHVVWSSYAVFCVKSVPRRRSGPAHDRDTWTPA